MQEYPPLPFLQIIDTYPEQITQFAFQLTRKTPSNLKKVSRQLNDLLISLKNDLFISDDTEQINKYVYYYILLYKLIAYTRDIFVGKGERDLTYMMIYVWYTQFPILAIHILHLLSTSSQPYPFGCWKDIKYFCNYVRENSPKKAKDGIIETCVNILNQQLIKDLQTQTQTTISLVSKWIPREKSKKFGWLFDKCAIQWSQIMYPEYYYFATTKPSIPFQNKIKREYRKNISNLNRQLDTVQIKQCENRWSHIRINTITENTKQKQFNVLLNQDMYGYVRRQTEDRNICRENLISHLFYETQNYETQQISYKKEIYSSFQMQDLIKEIEFACTIESMERINNNWDKVKGSILQNTENIIPILDLTTTNYINALSISIMLSEISKIQNKILVYDQIPVWVNLSETKSLFEKVQKVQEIKNSKQVETSNIFTALELLMISIQNTNMSSEDVANLVLCIVSDFSTPIKELQLHIHYFFHKNGYYKPPHIIYWNVSLQINIYYPCNAFTSRTLMISGTSSSCFQFLNDPLWKEYTPYTYLCNILGKERYHELEKYFLELTLSQA
jgi:hypothetical protein